MVSSPRKTFTSSFWLKIFVAVICLAFAGLEGWRDWNERADELIRAEVEMKNLAKSLAQHAEDTFNLADAIIVDIVDRMERQGAAPDTARGMQGFLSDRIRTLQALKTVTIIGEDGLILSSSLPGHTSVSVKDQAFFNHHATSPDRKWFFGPIIMDPIGAEWVLTLSRRINKPDGSFGGVVQVSIPPRYFANFFGRIDLGPGSAIAMLSTTDRRVLSRYPYSDKVIGIVPPNAIIPMDGTLYGSQVYTSSIDSVSRIGGYQKNHIYPVALIASLSEDHALSAWRKELQLRSAGVAVLVLIIGMLGWRLARELQRREQMESELAILATTDGLTGLANRRNFDYRLGVEWLRACRDGTPISLLLIDVDQFKAYNDIYGHQQGDESLRKVARVIAASIRRPGDFVARYGGEEIVVLLPNTDETGAAAVAENIRAQVEALAVQHEASAPSYVLTASIGSVTQRPASEGSLNGPANLILMADKALYRAKQTGRNRVAIAEAA